jgi:ADP-heptose:LPS heptosyltransferase
MLEASKMAGWNPVILSPPDECSLPPADIRGLMGRLYACDAVLAVSTGPMHIAAALGVPTLCLMERNINHCPKRWAPLGHRAEGIAYPGDKVKFGAGMDRFSPETVLAHLEKLCVGATR